MSVEQMLQASDAFARTVVADVAGGEVVGSHLRAEVDGDGLVSHVFEALQPGYRGWTWVVSLTAAAADAGAPARSSVCPRTRSTSPGRPSSPEP